MADKWVRLKSNGNILYPRTQSTLLQWGGPDMSGTFSAMDAAICDDLSANRFAGLPDECFVFERSTDAGKTWTVVSGQSGQAIVTSSGSFSNSNTTASQTIDARHRITITIAGYVYCELRKLLIDLSVCGATGCKCSVIYGDYSTPTVWSVSKTVPVSGWPGWNVINVSQVIGSSVYGNVKYLRLEFSITGVSSEYPSNLTVNKIRAFSNNCWQVSTELARTNKVYTTNNARDVNFPGGSTVTATKFKGALNGNADTATLATNSQNLGAQTPAYYLNWNNFTNKPAQYLLAGVQGNTTPSQTSEPYIYPVFDGIARGGVQLISGNGIQITSNNSNQIIIDAINSGGGIGTISSSYFVPHTTTAGLYKWTATEKLVCYNGTSTTTYFTLDRSNFEVYVYVVRNSNYTAWYIYYLSSLYAQLIYGTTTSSSGTYKRVNFPNITSGTTSFLATNEAATATSAGLMSAADKSKLNGIANLANNYTLPPATSSALGGIMINYLNSGSNKKVDVDNNNRAYVDVGLNIEYSALSNTFGTGKGHMVRINDTVNNNRYLFVWGETGSIADGAESTWSFPSVITSASPSSVYFVFQQKGNIGGALQYNNGTVIKTLSTTSITLRQNTNATNTFCYSGFFRW